MKERLEGHTKIPDSYLFDWVESPKGFTARAGGRVMQLKLGKETCRPEWRHGRVALWYFELFYDGIKVEDENIPFRVYAPLLCSLVSVSLYVKGLYDERVAGRYPHCKTEDGENNIYPCSPRLFCEHCKKFYAGRLSFAESDGA